MRAPADPNTSGPALGDRVEVSLTGTVVQVRTGEYPSLRIRLDDDEVVATDEDGVLTFRHPERVVLLRADEASR